MHLICHLIWTKINCITLTIRSKADFKIILFSSTVMQMICAWLKIWTLSGRLSLMRNVQLMNIYIYIYIKSKGIYQSENLMSNGSSRHDDAAQTIYSYVWKLNQTVLELDFRAVKFLFFPRRDLNSHHWYTAAPFA